MTLKDLRNEIKDNANAEAKAANERYFKTAKGGYSEGDHFIGVRVPFLRSLLKPARALDMDHIKELLYSKYHEERLFSLLICVDHYKKGDDRKKKSLHLFYLDHIAQVNNWDLVDSSAETLIGLYLIENNLSIDLLLNFTSSKSMWERRIAILSTFSFTKIRKLEPTYTVAKLLLKDSEDLMHKAVGWMLREAGKRDQKRLEDFLKAHYEGMPRTMLRYAIEKFPEPLRQSYLKGRV